jgi:hypothetical protein
MVVAAKSGDAWMGWTVLLAQKKNAKTTKNQSALLGSGAASTASARKSKLLVQEREAGRKQGRKSTESTAVQTVMCPAAPVHTWTPQVGGGAMSAIKMWAAGL